MTPCHVARGQCQVFEGEVLLPYRNVLIHLLYEARLPSCSPRPRGPVRVKPSSAGLGYAPAG
jgi:hypothetical protein